MLHPPVCLPALEIAQRSNGDYRYLDLLFVPVLSRLYSGVRLWMNFPFMADFSFVTRLRRPGRSFLIGQDYRSIMSCGIPSLPAKSL